MKSIKVKIEPQKDSDALYWMPKEMFFGFIDQEDFIENREVAQTADVYSSAWFYKNDSGAMVFIPPIIHVMSGKTQFINGRHRTSVLLRHLSNIPIGFTESAEQFAISLNLQKIYPEIEIELPDLPII